MTTGDPDPGTGSRPPSGMLLDESPVPARFGMTQAQELPPFETDELRRPCALAEDRSERSDEGRGADTPVPMVERRD